MKGEREHYILSIDVPEENIEEIQIGELVRNIQNLLENALQNELISNYEFDCKGVEGITMEK